MRAAATSLTGQSETTPPSAQDSHFRTDHLRGDLSRRALSGGVVTAISQVARFGLYMALTIIMARLLSPQDFGLVAMALAVMTVLHMFRDAGLSTATVQQETITHAQVSNLFWANVMVGVLCTLAALVLAPVLAWYYRDSRLFAITAWLSITLLAGGMAVQHLALLNRQMRFAAIAVIDVSSMLISLVAGICMAALGCGYWSLVGSQIAGALSELILAWSYTGWRPQFINRGTGTRSMLNFGASITAAMLLRRITSNIDSFLLGRFAGAYALGLYSRAMALVLRPLDQFLVPFDKVFVPVLSRVQDDPRRYRRTFLQIYSLLALVSFPIAGLLLGLSKPIVLILLGKNWSEVVPLFAALAVSALYYPVACASMWLVTTQRRNRDILSSGLAISAISTVSCLVGIPFGPLGVAIAFSAFGLLIRLPLQYFIVGREGPVSTADLWRVFLEHLPFWALVGAGAFAPQLLWPSQQPILSALGGSTLGVCAGLLLFLLPRYRAELQEVIELVKRVCKITASSHR